LLSTISKVDKKGRISIPIQLRAKLGLLEGRFVKIIFKNGSLILIPENFTSDGQSGVKASTRVREARRPSAIPGSDPKVIKNGGNKNDNKN